MKRRLIIEKNAVYEIDEECVIQKMQAERNGSKKRENNSISDRKKKK